MLSILLTAVVVVFALLAAMRLRSAGRAAACIGAAGVAFVLLARRPVDQLAQPRARFAYDIDLDNAVSPAAQDPARTRAVVEDRVRSTGHSPSELRVEGARVELQVAADPEGAARIREALSVVGRLEFAAVVDETDLIKSRMDAPDLPRGLRIEVENAPLGPGKTAPAYYAFMPLGEGELMSEALARLRAWTATLPVPDTQRIAFERVTRVDPDTETWQDEGFRTFLLERSFFLTNEDIREAQAMPDQSERSLGGWLVRPQFTPGGGDRFEQATAQLVKRRFAIVLDGIVESAPVVQGRISGGTGVITMGAGSPEEQAASAKRLEVILRSGALPAPLLLVSQGLVEPPLPRAGFQAVVGLLCLVLVAALAFALRMAFRRPSPLRSP